MIKYFLKDQLLKDELSDIEFPQEEIRIGDPSFLSENLHIVISDQDDQYNVQKVLNNFSINHLIGANSPHIKGEVQHSIYQLTQKRAWPKASSLVEHKIDSKVPLDQQIENLINGLDYAQYFDSPKDYLRIMLNELLTNSLRQCDCTKPCKVCACSEGETDKSDDVRLLIGMDDKGVTFSISDQKGLLDRKQVIDNLHRSFTEKSYKKNGPGAGLGLYFIFSFCNQMIINVHPQRKTQITCIIEKNKRLKKFKNRITSFHYFEEGPKEVLNGH